MAKLNVGFKIEYIDKHGISRVAWRQSIESADAYGKMLYHQGCRQIRISATPETVQKERAK